MAAEPMIVGKTIELAHPSDPRYLVVVTLPERVTLDDLGGWKYGKPLTFPPTEIAAVASPSGEAPPAGVFAASGSASPPGVAETSGVGAVGEVVPASPPAA